jgi:hypothetical protein
LGEGADAPLQFKRNPWLVFRRLLAAAEEESKRLSFLTVSKTL